MPVQARTGGVAPFVRVVAVMLVSAALPLAARREDRASVAGKSTVEPVGAEQAGALREEQERMRR